MVTIIAVKDLLVQGGTSQFTGLGVQCGIWDLVAEEACEWGKHLVGFSRMRLIQGRGRERRVQP